MPPSHSLPRVSPSWSHAPITPRRTAPSVAANGSRQQPGGSPQPITDAALQRHILVRLSKLGPRVSRNIRSHVCRGEVRLSGQIGSEYERQFVLQVVGQVAGIRQLTDSIAIRDTDATATESRSIGDESAPRITRARVRRAAGIAACLLLAVSLPAWSWLSGPEMISLPATLHVAGQPAAGALLVLHPLDRSAADAVRPRGLVAGDGTIEWATYERGDGLPPGEYAVTAIWNRQRLVNGEMQSIGNVLAAEYCRPETSPLRICVSADMAEPLCLEMPL